MSDWSQAGGNSQQQPSFQGTSSSADIVSAILGIVKQLSALYQIFSNGLITGTFTMSAAATFAVSDSSITGTSEIFLQAGNASAATLMGSAKSLFISSQTSGTGFTVATASGASAAGTEIFSYFIKN